MPNIELLDLVLNHIENNPEDWNQEMWRCGTTYCFAGHAALLSGWKPEGDDEELYWRLQGFESEEGALKFYTIQAEEEKRSNPSGTFWANKLERFTQYALNISDVVVKDDERRTISRVAREELGLDEITADVLFSAENSLDEIRNLVQEIKYRGYLAPSR